MCNYFSNLLQRKEPYSMPYGSSKCSRRWVTDRVETLARHESINNQLPNPSENPTSGTKYANHNSNVLAGSNILKISRQGRHGLKIRPTRNFHFRLRETSRIRSENLQEKTNKGASKYPLSCGLNFSKILRGEINREIARPSSFFV